MHSFQRTKIYQKCVVFPLYLQIDFSTTTVVYSLPLRKGVQVQNAIVPLIIFKLFFEESLTFVYWRMNYSQGLYTSASTKNAIPMSHF